MAGSLRCWRYPTAAGLVSESNADLCNVQHVLIFRCFSVATELDVMVVPLDVDAM